MHHTRHSVPYVEEVPRTCCSDPLTAALLEVGGEMHGESSIFTAACITIVYDCTLSHLLNAPSSASPVKYKTVLI